MASSQCQFLTALILLLINFQQAHSIARPCAAAVPSVA